MGMTKKYKKNGEICCIQELIDDVGTKSYQVTIMFDESPRLTLGECEIKQG